MKPKVVRMKMRVESAYFQKGVGPVGVDPKVALDNCKQLLIAFEFFTERVEKLL